MSQTTANPQHCPLCGQRNQCAIAANTDPASCWCMSTPISDAAKARARDQQQPDQCICAQCGRVAGASRNAPP